VQYSTDVNGERGRPVMIHRAIFGSLERMMAILIEHYAGRFPFWISPRQVMVVPVASQFNDYAQEVLRLSQFRLISCRFIKRSMPKATM
jgi:threonyl-tRNA synthetase